MANLYQISVRPVLRWVVVEYSEVKIDVGGESGAVMRGGSEVCEISCLRSAEEIAAARGAWRREQDATHSVDVRGGLTITPDTRDRLADLLSYSGEGANGT